MPYRFLLVQLADIGDLVLTTPAIAALREAQPDSHLALLTSAHSAKVVEDGLVDEIVTFDRRQFNSSWALLRPANLRQIFGLRHGNYDIVIFFHHFTLKLGTLKFWLIARASGASIRAGIDNGNGWFLTHRITDEGYGAYHQAQYWLNLVEFFHADTQPRRAHVALDRGVLPISAPRSKRIIIHTGSGGYSKARRWYPERFAEVADALHHDYRAEIVFVGTPDDDAASTIRLMQHKPVDLTGKTTLTQLADVLRSADVYIGADSGVMHLAASVGVPVVAIFGPSNHHAWSPWSPQGTTTVVRTAPICAPCSYVGHGVGAREGCEARTCMAMVSTGRVLDAAKSILDGGASQTRIPEWQSQPAFNDRIRILGLPVDRITYRQWMGIVGLWVAGNERRLHHVCTVNPEFMIIAQHDPIFANILHRADLCIPDGVGLLFAARMIGTELPERVTGSDGTRVIAQYAAEHGWRLFFLGAQDGIAERAAYVLQRDYPNLQIVGTYAGSPRSEDEADIVQRVNRSGADILLVAYGAPEQDKWIARNAPRLYVKMAMGVGGAFDFIAGVVPRAPQWMRDSGLEWLYRLYKQPWRIRRMLRLPRFVLAVIIRGED
jgi:N-acetylglucosaminyldiphosphoundecaprenol N-acetyl-beta-D-mannosaminyltransferase